MEADLQRAYDLVEQCKFDDAIGAFLEAGAWDEAGGLMSMYAQDFYQMGRVEIVLGWFESISKDEIENRPFLLLLWGKILVDDFSRHDEALKIFEMAESIFQELDNKIGQFKCKVWRSVSFRLMGQGIKSLEIIDDALANLETVDELVDRSTLSWATRYRALSYSITGQVDKALKELSQCLAEFMELGDRYHIALCHHDVGVCLERLARIAEAEYHYEAAVCIWQELGDKNNLINSLNSLAYLLCLTKQYERSLYKLEICLEIAQEIKSPYRQAIVWESIADVRRGEKDYSGAIKAYQCSNEFAIESKSCYLQVCNDIHIGECYLALGEETKALDCVSHVVDSTSESGLNTQFGEALALRSRVYMQQGRDFSGLYKKALGHIVSDVVVQNREKLRLAYGLLFCDFRPVAAYNLLLEVLDFLTRKDALILLSDTITETRLMFEYYLFHAVTPVPVANKIKKLFDDSLVSLSQNVDVPYFQMFGFGSPRLVTFDGRGGQSWQFKSRGVVGYLPELLMYLILDDSGYNGARLGQVGRVLWPDKTIRLSSGRVRQMLRHLSNEQFGGVDYIKRNSGRFWLTQNHWCDVLAFSHLSFGGSLDDEKILELQFLYQGEFLAGFELSPWGESFRESLKERYLQVAG